MPATRYLLALAKVEGELRRMLGVFATANQYDLVVMSDTNQALTWLDHHDPDVIVFDESVPRAEKTCHKARAKKTLFGVPIIAISADVTDVFVSKLFTIGADDVVPPSAAGALLARLKALPPPGSLKPPPDRGRAVVADAERSRSDVISRVLANAGYDVRQAHDRRVVEYYASHAEVRLFVLSSELIPPRTAIEQSRQGGGSAAWVVLSPKRDLETLVEGLENLERVAVTSAHTPPEDVLFLSNELMSGQGGALRQSERVLYGTVVAFRAAGGELDDVGFCYNISRNGVYVRTLAAPEGETVWIELRPPRAKARVRLQGRIAWRRPFGRIAGATAPPGFGVELVDGLGEGLKEWKAAYESFVGPRRASSTSIEVAPVAEPPKAAMAEESDEPPIEPRLSDIDELSDAVTIPPPAAAPPRGKSTMVGLGNEPRVIVPPLPPPTPAAAAEASTPGALPALPPIPPMPTPIHTQSGALEDSPPAEAPSSPDVTDGTAPMKLPELHPVPHAERELPRATASRAPRRRGHALPLVAAVLIAGGAAAAVAVVGGRERLAAEQGAAPERPAAKPAAAPLPSPAATTQTPAPAPAPAASEAPVAAGSAAAPEAAPAASSPEATPKAGPATAIAPAEAPLPPIVDTGGDPATLARNQGYLIVRFSGEGGVYVNGRPVGAVNQKLTVQCGTRFLRVGEPVRDTTRWLSVGRTVSMVCQDTTTVTFERNERGG
jgi:DNA-binding response OmpR family regulator